MSFTSIIDSIDAIVWGIPTILLILVTGVVMTISARGIQFTKLKRAFLSIFKDNEGKGELSGFAALCTALSATIGTGNIVGVATAIVAGGPGALFWMWIAAVLGTATKYAECMLAIKYREVSPDGHVLGGPFYTIEKGMGPKWKWLAVLFALCGAFAGIMGTGTMTQINGITSAVNNAFDPNSTNIAFAVGGHSYSWATVIGGAIVTICTALVVIGGIQRISKVAEKLVPAMAVIYVFLGLSILVMNTMKIPGAFVLIFKSAFGWKAVGAGAMGFVFKQITDSMQKGIARGIFSNEAGLGTGSIAHACADTSAPVKQGLFGIFEVFADTIVICTLTALVILCSGVTVGYGQAAGAELTISGFVATYGNWVSVFTAVAMCCFAFSTIIGWGLYGARCIEFLFSVKVIRPFLVVYSFMGIVGATMDLGLLWSIAETFNGLMAIPNLIALFLLSGTVVKLAKEYFENYSEPSK